MFYLEEAVNMLPGSTILHIGVGVLPHHVIDGVHDVSHLLDRPKGGKEAGTKKPKNVTDIVQHNTTQSFHANTESGRERFKHLSGYAAILVQVVQIEGPVEFVSDGASQNDGQTYDKVLQQDKEKLAMTEIIKSHSNIRRSESSGRNESERNREVCVLSPTN